MLSISLSSIIEKAIAGLSAMIVFSLVAFITKKLYIQYKMKKERPILIDELQKSHRRLADTNIIEKVPDLPGIIIFGEDRSELDYEEHAKFTPTFLVNTGNMRTTVESIRLKELEDRQRLRFNKIVLKFEKIQPIRHRKKRIKRLIKLLSENSIKSYQLPIANQEVFLLKK